MLPAKPPPSNTIAENTAAGNYPPGGVAQFFFNIGLIKCLSDLRAGAARQRST